MRTHYRATPLLRKAQARQGHGAWADTTVGSIITIMRIRSHFAGGASCSVRTGLSKAALPPQAAASQARHLGGRSGLVQKDQPVRLRPNDRLARQGPFLARLLDVGPILLAGPQSFMEWPAPPSGVVGSPANQEEEGMDISVLGIDLGKNVCSVVGLDASGAVVMRRKVRRETLIALAEKLPPCVVGMEACCGAHHLGRVFAAHGHDVRLMSPEYVGPYIKAQKNDDRDAEGIAEA